MIPLEEAREFVLSSCTRLGPVELPTDLALGCVTAETVISDEQLPPFANSSMDGYALRAADTRGAPVTLEVAGTLMAGDPTPFELTAGQALRIMTGAPIPAGADAVCMVERTRLEDDLHVVVEDELSTGTNVRPAGDDIDRGDEVVARGTELGPGHLGVLGALGIERVDVFRRPKVGVLSTGDELVEAVAGPLPPGKIRDANRHSLLALVRGHGEAVDFGIVPDDEKTLAKLLEDATADCDAIVTSGGVSVGDRDVVRLVLDEMSGGTMRWMQVAIKPAKPFAFGLLGRRRVPVFGLPGNPVSAMVSFELFARPALRLMAGHTRLDRPVLRAIARVAIERRPDGKLHLLRAVARVGSDGTLEVRPAQGQGSHHLSAMAGANALALLPDGVGVREGDPVDLLLLDAEQVDSDAPVGAAWVR